ncbi:MAG: DUF3096 domain-containing protein [Xanthomonadaceae bacterium]|nr:DUF3096 domain-containing protein [Xanthomonadaceae bacterium]
MLPGCGVVYSLQADVVSITLIDEETTMNMTLSIAPLVSLIAGILILLVPRLLNYIVAIYLIVIGLLGLFGAGGLHI